MTNRVTDSNGVVYNDVANLLYTEQVNTESYLKPGAVCAGCIQFDLFTENGEHISTDDVLTYYQVDDHNVATLIGTFTVSVVERRRAKQVITAYDNIIKLDADFTLRLAQLQNSFPITLGQLVAEACGIAGVTLNTDQFPLYALSIQKFYKDKLTCRQLISWAAELACCFVKCNSAGELVFGWYSVKEKYRIYPTSGTTLQDETCVFYKMNGLVYSGEKSVAVDYVKINLTDDEANSYYYPQPYSTAYAADPNDDGNLTFFNLTAVDNNSNIAVISNDLVSYDIADDGEVIVLESSVSPVVYADDYTGDGDLQLFHFTSVDTGDASYGEIILQSNDVKTMDRTNDGDLSILVDEESGSFYFISDNLLLTDADDITLYSVAQRLYDMFGDFPVFRETEVDLFMFFNPYCAGQIAKVTDIHNVSFVFPIMKMEFGNGSAHLSSEHWD